MFQWLINCFEYFKIVGIHRKITGKTIGSSPARKQYAKKLRSILPVHFEPISLRFAHGRTLKPYDFGIFGRVREPQSQLFLFFETPGYSKHLEKIKIIQNMEI